MKEKEKEKRESKLKTLAVSGMKRCVKLHKFNYLDVYNLTNGNYEGWNEVTPATSYLDCRRTGMCGLLCVVQSCSLA